MKAPPNGPIPFTKQGLLPPVDARWGNSPIALSPEDLVHQLGRSKERIKLLQSLFRYRAELRAAGVTGFQWVHGDFVEDCEGTREEPPFAIEVMNFAFFEKEEDLTDSQKSLLYDDFFVSGAFEGLLVTTYQTFGKYFISERVLTTQFGFASHIINDLNDPCLSLWKGLLRIRLGDNPDEDASAQKLLLVEEPR